MKLHFLSIIILLLLIPHLGSARTGVGSTDRDYYLQVDLSQWKIEVYDLNSIEDLILSGVPYSDAKEQSRFTDRIVLDKNSEVHLQVYSMDVEHGVSISGIGIQETIERRDFSVYTLPVYIDFTGPSEDKTIEISCHVYCGIGHTDMKFKLQFGVGDVEFGKPILYGFVIVNLIILAYFVRLVWTEELNGMGE